MCFIAVLHGRWTFLFRTLGAAYSFMAERNSVVGGRQSLAKQHRTTAMEEKLHRLQLAGHGPIVDGPRTTSATTHS
jgi:hypothetical protein